MTTMPFQIDCLNEQNMLVIQAYTLRAKTQKATQENFDGWLERINQLEGFDKVELVQLHGQLIAMGFLKFEISGSSKGLRYQVSTSGKNALERELAKRESGENSEQSFEDSDDEQRFEEFADAAA